MALKGRRINNVLELGCLVASRVVGISVSSISFQKSNIGWPQQPPTENYQIFKTIFLTLMGSFTVHDLSNIMHYICDSFKQFFTAFLCKLVALKI